MQKALFRFVQLSCVSFVVNFGLTFVLHEWAQMSEEAAFAMALAVVLLMNFLLMRWYVYETKVGAVWQQFGLYLGSACVFRAAEYGAFLLWHTWYGSDYRLAVVGITVISAGMKFFYYRVLL
jgi:putative flippase GtrA